MMAFGTIPQKLRPISDRTHLACISVVLIPNVTGKAELGKGWSCKARYFNPPGKWDTSMVKEKHRNYVTK